MTLDPRLDAWLSLLEQCGGTELLLTDGLRPLVRRSGRLEALEEAEILTGEEIEAIARMQIGDQFGDRLHLGQELEFSFTWRNSTRIVANAFYQRRTCSVLFHRIVAQIPTPEALGLPPALVDQLERGGLILVTGPSGSGRSTTLASLLDVVNRRRPCHIVTIEDPIEYNLESRTAVVSQREVGVDTASFAQALRSVGREAPDVVMIADLPDLSSVSGALAIAETGRLVLAASPVAGAAAAVERLIDVFPRERRSQARVQLAGSLSAVLYQRLVPGADGAPVAAYELLLGTAAVRRAVRDGCIERLEAVLEDEDGSEMVSLESYLQGLVADGRVVPSAAAAVSRRPESFASPV